MGYILISQCTFPSQLTSVQCLNATGPRPVRRKMRRCSAVAWNPEVATQLVVACEDDLSPTLQLWDLRNSVAPLREFNAHDKARPFAALRAACPPVEA